MFSPQDLKGIQLQKLINYINDNNIQQKHYETDFIDCYSFEHSSQDDDNTVDLNTPKSIKKDAEKGFDDLSSQIKDEINQYYKHTEKNQSHLKQKNRQDDDKNIMLTMPNEQQGIKDVKKNNCKKISKYDNCQLLKKNVQSFPKLNLTPINMKSLMLSLKNNTMDHLKHQFIHNQNKITLERFLWLMKQCIAYHKTQQYEISYELIKLFEQIDIDCNQFIDWNEFLQYMACYGWTNDTKTHLQGGQGAERGKKPNYITDTWNQANKHRKNTLSKIVEIEKLGMLCLIEARNFTLSFINIKGKKHTVTQQNKAQNHSSNDKLKQSDSSSDLQDSHDLAFNSSNNEQQFTTFLFTLNHIDHHKVLSLDYSEPEKLFGVLQTDRKVHFIEQGEIQKSWGQIEGTGNQIDIMYLPLHKKWLLKRMDQYIDIFASPKDKNNKERITFKPHQKEAITAIKQLKQPLSLITAGIDGKIKIWTLVGKQLLIELRAIGEQDTFGTISMKTKGVRGIDTLNSGIQSYFCSWIFTTEIMLWLPSSSVSKPYIGKLTGHSGIVESCQFVKPQHCSKFLLISIDNKKVIKIWSVDKMQCIQSLTHQGQGCRIKCLNNSPIFCLYNRVIEFNKLKLNSLMIGSQKQQEGAKKKETKAITEKNSSFSQTTPVSIYHKNDMSDLKQASNFNAIPFGFVQAQFCNHNILLLLLLTTQLRIINLQTGQVQSIFEPCFKDEEQFVWMSVKINRRVFILSTLGYLYYVKVDDGTLIRRMEVNLSAKESRQTKPGRKYHGKNLATTIHGQTHSSTSNFLPRFVHYHIQSKTILIVVEVSSLSSMLMTYIESTSYQFEKMKEIQFPQSDLQKMFFFTTIDVMLLVNDDMITIWDWNKLLIVNVIDFDKSQQTDNKPTPINKSIEQQWLRHIAISQDNSTHSPLIILLNKHCDLIVYKLSSSDYSIELTVRVSLQHKLQNSIASFYLVSSTNQQLQYLLQQKVNDKNTTTNLTKEKTPHSNPTPQDHLNRISNPHVEDLTLKNNPIQNSLNPKSNFAPNNLIYSKTTPFQNQSLPNTNIKTAQKNNIISKNTIQRKKDYLYITSEDGHLHIYDFNQIMNLFIKDTYFFTTQEEDNILSPETNENSTVSNNLFIENSEKKYASHKIRQNRKANLKYVSSLNKPSERVQLQENLLLSKDIIKTSWSSTLGQLYTGLIYALTEKQELFLIDLSANIVGNWNLRSMSPKYWQVPYQQLPKVIDRLNRLEMILEVQNEQRKRTKPTKTHQQEESNQADIHKILFLANRYLDQNDVLQLRQSIKMSSNKLIDMSKKNILYNQMSAGMSKNDGKRNSKSIKKINDFKESGPGIKNTVTFSHHITHQGQDKKFPTSIKNFVENTEQQSPSKEFTQTSYPSHSSKKRKHSTMNSNFFEEKFEKKIQEENRLKIHKNFIDKQVEKTLNHAKKLQLKTIQNTKVKQRFSLNTQASRKSFLNEKLNKETKQQVEQFRQSTNAGLINENNNLKNISRKSFPFQTNQIMIEQQKQKKEIEKNFEFVKRIQDSIHRIQLEYTTSWTKHKNSLEISACNQKDLDKNNKNEASATQKIESRPPNTQKSEQSNIKHRKASIADNLLTDQNFIKTIKQGLKNTNNFLLKKQKRQESNPSQEVIGKKNVQFSDDNKVIVYEISEIELGKKEAPAMEKRPLFEKNNKIVRSLSAVNYHTRTKGFAVKEEQKRSRQNSPLKKDPINEISSHQKPNQKPKQLIKSRSLYGGQFSRQKELTLNNFRQGMRQFQTFYKKFSQSAVRNELIIPKKNKIKIG